MACVLSEDEYEDESLSAFKSAVGTTSKGVDQTHCVTAAWQSYYF